METWIRPTLPPTAFRKAAVAAAAQAAAPAAEAPAAPSRAALGASGRPKLLHAATPDLWDAWASNGGAYGGEGSGEGVSHGMVRW